MFLKEMIIMSEKLKNLFLLLYFPILTIERVISLVTFFGGNMSGYDFLDWYMVLLTISATIAAYVYLFAKCPEAVNINSPKNGEQYGDICIAAGLLLLGEWCTPKALSRRYSSRHTA